MLPQSGRLHPLNSFDIDNGWDLSAPPRPSLPSTPHSEPTAVTEQFMETEHAVLFDNVKILTNGKTDKELLIKESLFVKKLKPNLNNNVASYPLELF